MNQIFEIPLFPLGSVLFPGGFLPLHIFETRYQQLLNKALETDRRFGVVLISRGSDGSRTTPIREQWCKRSWMDMKARMTVIY